MNDGLERKYVSATVPIDRCSARFKKALGHDRHSMSIKFATMPSYDRLHELLKYNPETGDLRWRFRRPGTRSDGIAGCVRTKKNGRQDWTIAIDGKQYISSRIIWMLYYHHDPGSLTIDHVDRNPLNNRISNLRLADIHEQCLNRRCTSPSTAIRYIGLAVHSYRNGRPGWCGQIRISNRLYYFGSVPVDSIDDPPPDWLIARSARLYTMRDDPDITDDTLIDEINALKRVPPMATAAE